MLATWLQARLDHRRSSGLELGEKRQDIAELRPFAGWCQALANLLIEGDQADRVLLPDHQVAKGRRQADPVFEFGQLLPVSVSHRGREVHHEVAGQVGLGLELLDVEPVGLGVDVPVDVADVVAGGVLAMLGELDRKALKRAGVQPRDEALDDELARRSSRATWRITSGFRYFSAVPATQGLRSNRVIRGGLFILGGFGLSDLAHQPLNSVSVDCPSA